MKPYHYKHMTLLVALLRPDMSQSSERLKKWITCNKHKSATLWETDLLTFWDEKINFTLMLKSESQEAICQAEH